MRAWREAVRPPMPSQACGPSISHTSAKTLTSLLLNLATGVGRLGT